MNDLMNDLIKNEINGNLRDAKKLASLTAAWLKGADCRQAACDAN